MMHFPSRRNDKALPPNANWQPKGRRTEACLREGQFGFTLIELMITLAISAILLSVAAPAYQSFIGSTALTTATNDLVAALNMARSEALKRDGQVSLRAADIVSDDFADGYCLVPGKPANCDGALRSFPAVGSEITMVVAGGYDKITFDGLGGLSETSNNTRAFELCRANEDHRRVTIALVGRSKVSADASCPS